MCAWPFGSGDSVGDLRNEERFEARLRENVGLSVEEKKRRLRLVDQRASSMPAAHWRLTEKPEEPEGDAPIVPDGGSCLPSRLAMRGR